MTLDETRQREDRALLASGAEFSFGDEAASPATPAMLAALGPTSPGVEAVFDEGLTARVLRWRAPDGRDYAVKRARVPCLVQNADGEASFLNELRRHAELRPLGLQGVVRPLFGSLRHGVVVSPWIDGTPVREWNVRRLRQVLQTACRLAVHGFFEWDFSPGNVLDDGEQVWLFDFGYMYRFDPLCQWNSAGRGDDLPQFHPAERVETRNVFAWLLELERRQGEVEALAAFRLVKEAACEAYRDLHGELSQRGAAELVLQRLERLIASWQAALEGDLSMLYLREGWRSHRLDVLDDLHGRSCTPLTLARCDWLLDKAATAFADLRRAGALEGEEAGLSARELVCRHAESRALAERLQLPS